MLAVAVLLLEKRTAEMRAHAQYIEEIRRDLRPRNQLRAAFAGEAHRDIAIRADAFEGVRPLAPFHQLPEIDRQRPALQKLRRRSRNRYQSRGIRKIERPQQNPVHQRENRGIGADADHQAEHRHRSEAPIVPKRPQCIFHVR